MNRKYGFHIKNETALLMYPNWKTMITRHDKKIDLNSVSYKK